VPVTPFHFGLGVLFKGIAPARTSLLSFVASQVVIDLETAFHLLRGEWPVHRALHTFILATPVGLLTGLLIWCVGRWLGRFDQRWPAEFRLAPALVGGGLGGLTHPLLDGVMHSDIQPLAPFTTRNPLYLAIGLGWLHWLCVAAAVVGGLLWSMRPAARDSR
jgi:hypothetical protein